MKYFPRHRIAAALRDSDNDDCLVRVYLGQRRSDLSPYERREYSSLRNFELYLDQMEEVGLDIYGLAGEMAVGLAIAHWIAKIDCIDSEFVLGTSATYADMPQVVENHKKKFPRSLPQKDFSRRLTHLWHLDFDKADQFEWTKEVVEGGQLINGVMGHDPVSYTHLTLPTKRIV